jgi:hypothetical protein
VDAKALFIKIMAAYGEKHPKSFILSDQPATLTALEQVKQVASTGTLPAAKPGDNHKVFIQLFQMFMQTPEFMALAQTKPAYAQALQAALEQHLAYAAQMAEAAQAAGAAQAQEGQPETAGQPAVAPAANADAQGRFDMAGRGAIENGGRP